jgi:EAL domain-containing protein (putative c-di-GMP-specific phosphodiesterase class I)
VPPEPNRRAWYFESYAADSKSLWRFPLLGFPLRVGRRAGVGLSLPSPHVSQDHAEISLAGGTLRVRDLGSTNGTFVNGVRITDGKAARLKEGDVLHFANAEFLLGRLAPGERNGLMTRTALNLQMPRQFVDRARHLNDLLRKRAVVSFVQPIVHLQSGKIMGYELLGRGTSNRLPRDPKGLFDLAETLGVAGELSHLFRTVGTSRLRRMPGRPVLFFNTHPEELEKSGLAESLQALRRELPKERLALEIHEQAVTSPSMVRELRRTLAELDIQLAYDDFGAGRGRINELIEVPPDYLKFDETLIHAIDRAPRAKHDLLQALVRVCRDGEIQTLAEGVETEAEAHTLRELGFDLAQGYLFGKPAPAAVKTKSRRRTVARKSARARK